MNDYPDYVYSFLFENGYAVRISDKSFNDCKEEMKYRLKIDQLEEKDLVSIIPELRVARSGDVYAVWLTKEDRPYNYSIAAPEDLLSLDEAMSQH